MKNFVQEGDVVNMKVGVAVTSGYVYLINDIIAIATISAGASDTAAFMLMGVFDVPKNPSELLPAGRAVYWDNTNKWLTATVGSNKKFGFTVEQANAGMTLVRAYLYALS